MTLRRSHGTGRSSAETVVETLPVDELPSASPDVADRPQRGADGRFVAGNRLAQSKRIRGPNATALGLRDEVVRAFVKWGRRLSSHRRAELARLHGGHLSAGVSAMVDDAALIRADARLLRQRALETGDNDLLKRAADMMLTASSLDSRAWEYAAKEAAARENSAGPRDPLADHYRRPDSNAAQKEKP